MRCLLDKVTARFIVQGLIKLAEQRAPAENEAVALDLFVRAISPTYTLFIVPATANVLDHLARYPHYAPLIQLFLTRVEVIQSRKGDFGTGCPGLFPRLGGGQSCTAHADHALPGSTIRHQNIITP